MREEGWVCLLPPHRGFEPFDLAERRAEAEVSAGVPVAGAGGQAGPGAGPRHQGAARPARPQPPGAARPQDRGSLQWIRDDAAAEASREVHGGVVSLKASLETRMAVTRILVMISGLASTARWHVYKSNLSFKYSIQMFDIIQMLTERCLPHGPGPHYIY